MTDAASGTHFVAFDGNGNVSALVKGADGTVAARYEYGPFGEAVRANGPAAQIGSIRFSTKWRDDEPDTLFYGCRYYNPSAGKWLSRDRFQEGGGPNLNGFVGNDPLNKTDPFGYWATSVHHQIVEDWLTNPKYRNYPWRCCTIDVVRLIQDGSDEVDGVNHRGWPWFGWCEAQSSANSYQHAMRDGEAHQSVDSAEAQYNQFIAHNLVQAVSWAGYARENGRCYLEEWALSSLGRAYHSFSDSLSPAHRGFQPWWGPIDGSLDFDGPFSYLEFVLEHEYKETDAVYAGMKAPVVAAVDKKFRAFLNFILRD
jgi:RHS repeat-associated protein